MSAVAVKELVPRVGRFLFGRRAFARFARFLWLRSRSDVPNDFETNGERAFQQTVVRVLFGDEHVVVFDVGANVGIWSAPLAQDFFDADKLGRLSLHLFEPSPDSFASLQDGMERFRGGHVVLNQCAVGKHTDKRFLYVMGRNAGTNTLRPGDSDDVNDVIEVDCINLDAYCRTRGIKKIDFMKIDVEGGDLEVLLGAEGLLRQRAVRFVQFEYNHRWVFSRAFLRDVFELVGPYGYSVGKLTPTGVERYHEWHPELESFREGNYLIWRDQLPGPQSNGIWWQK
jgi:FkbM family methyltransferase